MNPTLQRDGLTETYNDMECLVCKIAWRFAQAFNEDFEEVRAEANLHFVNAMQSYDKNRGAITTHLTIYITGHLRNYFKNERKRIKTTSIYDKFNSTHRKFIDYHHIDISMIDILDELKDDARTLVDLVLDAPKSVLTDVVRPKARYVRASIKRYVTKSKTENGLGWSNAKYKRTAEQVANAL